MKAEKSNPLLPSSLSHSYIGIPFPQLLVTQLETVLTACSEYDWTEMVARYSNFVTITIIIH